MESQVFESPLGRLKNVEFQNISRKTKIIFQHEFCFLSPPLPDEELQKLNTRPPALLVPQNVSIFDNLGCWSDESPSVSGLPIYLSDLPQKPIEDDLIELPQLLVVSIRSTQKAPRKPCNIGHFLQIYLATVVNFLYLRQDVNNL